MCHCNLVTTKGVHTSKLRLAHAELLRQANPHLCKGKPRPNELCHPSGSLLVPGLPPSPSLPGGISTLTLGKALTWAKRGWGGGCVLATCVPPHLSQECPPKLGRGSRSLCLHPVIPPPPLNQYLEGISCIDKLGFFSIYPHKL